MVTRSRTFDEDGYVRRAACLCFKDINFDEVLLISSKRRGNWIVPGGGVEACEADPCVSASRELEEEAGAVAKSVSCLGMFQNRERIHRTMVYVCVLDKMLPFTEWVEGKKGRTREWFPITEALTHLRRYKPIQCAYLEFHCSRSSFPQLSSLAGFLQRDSNLLSSDGRGSLSSGGDVSEQPHRRSLSQPQSLSPTSGDLPTTVPSEVTIQADYASFSPSTVSTAESHDETTSESKPLVDSLTCDMRSPEELRNALVERNINQSARRKLKSPARYGAGSSSGYSSDSPPYHLNANLSSEDLLFYSDLTGDSPIPEKLRYTEPACDEEISAAESSKLVFPDSNLSFTASSAIPDSEVPGLNGPCVCSTAAASELHTTGSETHPESDANRNNSLSNAADVPRNKYSTGVLVDQCIPSDSSTKSDASSEMTSSFASDASSSQMRTSSVCLDGSTTSSVCRSDDSVTVDAGYESVGAPHGSRRPKHPPISGGFFTTTWDELVGYPLCRYPSLLKHKHNYSSVAENRFPMAPVYAHHSVVVLLGRQSGVWGETSPQSANSLSPAVYNESSASSCYSSYTSDGEDSLRSSRTGSSLDIDLDTLTADTSTRLIREIQLLQVESHANRKTAAPDRTPPHRPLADIFERPSSGGNGASTEDHNQNKTRPLVDVVSTDDTTVKALLTVTEAASTPVHESTPT